MAQATVENIYFYNPSLAAAVIFMVLYLLLVIAHFYLAVILPRSQSEKHRYMIPCLVAALISSTGFGTRIASVKSTGEVGLYATSASLIVISPIFVCASLYWLLAHLIRWCIPESNDQIFFGLQPRWLGRIFITSDIISFMTQGSGSGIAASNNWIGDTKTIGISVLLAGLAMQLATFSLFLVVFWCFCRRVRIINNGFDPVVKGLVNGVWVASACVEIRSIYRTIEFALGIEGYPFQHEWPLYVLEAVPMLAAISILGWHHPVRVLQGSSMRSKGNSIGLNRVRGEGGSVL